MKFFISTMLLTSLLSAGNVQAHPAGPPTMNDDAGSAFDRAFDPSRKLNEFKASVDWDRKILADDRKFIIDRNWADFGSNATSIARLNIDSRNRESIAVKTAKGTLFVLNGTFDDATVSIHITQAHDLEGATEFFLSQVTNTSLARLNYVAGPRDLGTVAAKYDVQGPGGSILWIYKNVCFDVRSSDFKVVEFLSSKIQRLAEQSLTPIPSGTQPSPSDPARL